MKSMAIKFSRRLIVYFIGSLGALFSFGAGAQQQSEKAPPRDAKIDIAIPDGAVPVVGPIVTAPRTEISFHANGLLIVQSTTVDSSQLSNQTGNASVEKTGLRIQQSPTDRR
jgi:hypothetical protein